MMRSVELDAHFTFNFPGSVDTNAICVGDFDNDGENELIMGNTKGELAIFKGTQVIISMNGSLVHEISINNTVGVARNFYNRF
jgi:hypothetical protein